MVASKSFNLIKRQNGISKQAEWVQWHCLSMEEITFICLRPCTTTFFPIGVLMILKEQILIVTITLSIL
jgi:hypothetical protein